jgi:signal peptidase
MVLVGKDAENIEIGDIIVFNGNRKDPIIHRIVKKMQDNGKIYFQTKGDNNADSIKNNLLDETNLKEDVVIGKVVLRVPLLGYIKIWFVELLKFAGLA